MKMNEAKSANSRHATVATERPYRVHLPGFVSDDDIGLGDVIKRATAAIGIKPCDGCRQRAAALNRWLVFSGRRVR